MKTKLLFAGLLMMTLCSLPAASAQDFIARQMRFTIDRPVEFPGHILQPGTYFIRSATTPLRQGTDSVIFAPQPSLEKPSDPPTPALIEPAPPAPLPKTRGEAPLLVLVGCVFLIGFIATRLVSSSKMD